jgi:NAD(P)H-dependent FMN reductase
MAGSLRKESYNKRLAKIAAAAAQSVGAEVTYLDLRDFPLPLFDEDLEAQEGPPLLAQKLKAIFKAQDGFLFACPEYNSSITGAFKNAIDWASRPAPGEPPLAAFTDKVAALMSASPGALGGLRGLVHVRAILGNVNVLVLPDQVAVPRAFDAFQSDGSLKDAKQQAGIEALGKKLAATIVRLKT